MTASGKKLLLKAEHGVRRFEIADGGAGVGYYLFVYEGPRCTHDYLQDTLEQAREVAAEEFGVPQESWADAQTNS